MKEARCHYYGLQEAIPSFKGLALFDHLEEDNDVLYNDSNNPSQTTLQILMWQRNEIENYFCTREALQAYANPTVGSQAKAEQLTTQAETQRKAMDEAIEEITNALRSLGKDSPWNPKIKASEDVLLPIFKAYARRLGIYNEMSKKDLYKLVACISSAADIDPEVTAKLEAIVAVAEAAQPGGAA